MRKLQKFSSLSLIFGSVGLVIAVVLILLVSYWIVVLPQGEVGAKDGYSFLQSVEIESKHVKDSDLPLVIDKTASRGFKALGVESNDKDFPRTWIILNKTAPDGGVLIIPANNEFKVSCQYVDDLWAREPFDSKVLQFLQKGCK